MTGRPRATDKAAVLQAIHDQVTTSPTELAKNLNVNRATIHRRLQEIKQEEINQALGVITEGNLKPAETDFTVFCKIPEVKRYSETLRYMRKNTARYANKRLRMLYRVCVLLKQKPVSLTPQTAANLLIKIRKGEVKIGEYDFRMGMRLWFGFRGVSGAQLCSLGLDADNTSEDRSHLKFTRERIAGTYKIRKEYTTLDNRTERERLHFNSCSADIGKHKAVLVKKV